MADIERGEFVDCDLRRADFYRAALRRARFVGCDLTGAELTKVAVEALRIERSTIVDLGGIGDLRDIVLTPDEIVSFALPFLASFGITVDDGDD
jgi:uncharacterized protein YjbI with pentapeptide repeats